LRRILIGMGALLVAALAVAAAGAGVLFGPYFLQDRALDGAVVVAALDWRDFGRDVATERLQLELDKRGIGRQVQDEDCVFSQDGDERTVRCAWRVAVQVPLAGWVVPMAFTSEARIDPAGDLR